MGSKVSPMAIGAFVLGGIALAVIGVGVFGSGRLFRQQAHFVLYFDRSVNGLRRGAPVKFKGVEIGSVNDIRLTLGTRELVPEDTRIPVIIEIDQERFRAKGGRVVVMDAEAMRELVGQGLRAQLNTESFVTGVLYVEMDFFPGKPANLVNDSSVPYLEIPTLPTTLEQVQQRGSEIITKLAEIDFKHLIDAATQTVDGMNQVFSSPDLRAAVASLPGAVREVQSAAGSVRSLAGRVEGDLGPLEARLRDTASEAEHTLASIRALLSPGAPIPYQLGQTLMEVGDAARALRQLADYLERNPSALVRGRPSGEGGR